MTESEFFYEISGRADLSVSSDVIESAVVGDLNTIDSHVMNESFNLWRNRFYSAVLS